MRSLRRKLVFGKRIQMSRNAVTRRLASPVLRPAAQPALSVDSHVDFNAAKNTSQPHSALTHARPITTMAESTISLPLLRGGKRVLSLVT